MSGALSHAGRAMTLLEADLQQTRAALTAARADLAAIDATLARRPALDKPTRRENIEYACAENQRLADALTAARATAARLRVALVKARAAVMHLGQQQSIPDDDSWSMDLIDIDAALAAKEA